MSGSTYVLTMLGEAPAVHTELLWWLGKVGRNPIAGIEAWGTRRGADQLRALVAGPAWRALQDAVGQLPTLEPEGSPPDVAYGFRIHEFEGEGGVLDDIRSEGAAARVNAVLHDRVRELRRSLKPGIVLLGSIAGGRKVMSAALQTAFSLQARPQDRLVHVLLHPALEVALREAGRLQEYSFPTAAWASATGVAQEEQVTVYDVPFPRVRGLVRGRLDLALDGLPWDEVWTALDRNSVRATRAVLRRSGAERWVYEVVDGVTGEVACAASLGRRAGATLAALASGAPDAGGKDLVDWLDRHDVAWAPPGGDVESRTSSLRGAIRDLRKGLRAAIPVGFDAYIPREGRYHVEGVEVLLDWGPPMRSRVL